MNAICRATELFFCGRYDECIDACSRIAPSDDAERSELALLNARAMLRADKPLQASFILTAAAASLTTLDAQLTSALLLAAACTQRGSPDEALERLRGAESLAQRAHHSIRSEFELCRAHAYFAKNDLASALLHVLRIRGDSDVIHAQGLALQGSCYDRLGNRRDAATSFVAALVRLDTCRQQDHGAAAAALAGLAKVTAELTDVALMRVVEHRHSTLEWSPNMRAPRCIVELSMMSAAIFAGDLTRAGECALAALHEAPSQALSARSYAGLARVARHAGDVFLPPICLEAAGRIVANPHNREFAGQPVAREALLDVIEEAAVVDITRAHTLFARYRKLEANAGDAPAENDRLRGREYYVEALLLEAERRLPLAQERFRAAYELFRQTDSTARAIEAAYHLAQLGDESMNWYVLGALGGITNWMTAGLRRSAGSLQEIAEIVERRRAVFAALTQPQREVVDLVCSGQSNPQIARARKTTVQTVKNMLTGQIFPAFGVSTRLELKSVLAELAASNVGATASPHREGDVSFAVRLEKNA